MIIEPYQWQKSSITALTKVAVDTLAVRTEKPPGYNFTAGQYTVTRITTESGQRLVRQYSFSSAPSASYLEFTIQHEPGGDVTSWFHKQAHANDTIELSQPFGRFMFASDSRSSLFIGGRVGIAPFMSMLREHQPQDATILYSVRSLDQICFEDELRTHDAHIVVTEQYGRITAETLAPLIASRPICYLCGSRQFVEAMQQTLNLLGVPPTDIKRELFTL